MFSLFTKVPSISATDLKKKLTSAITLIDVRTSSEYQMGHIAKAKNVPLDQIHMYNKKVQTIYVICQSGMRSAQAARILKKNGYDVINVQGGMNQWSGPIKGGK